MKIRPFVLLPFLTVGVLSSYVNSANGQNKSTEPIIGEQRLASSKPQPLNESLIPFKVTFLKQFYLAPIFGDQWKNFREGPHPDANSTYRFSNGDVTIELNGLTGQIETWEFKNYGILNPDWHSILEVVIPLLIDKADFSQVNETNKDGLEDIYFYSKSGSNSLWISVDSKDKKIQIFRRLYPNTIWVNGMEGEKYKISLPVADTIKINQNQALQIALYYISQGRSRLTFPVKKYSMGEKTVDKISLILAKDKWLLSKHIWVVDFEAARVFVDAESGEVIESEANPKWEGDSYSQKYKADSEIIYNKPNFAFKPHRSDAEIAEQSTKNCSVTFDGQELNISSRQPDLHYAPLRVGSTSLILSRYFTSFLINIKRNGGEITLNGQLAAKGKKAELTIGSTNATVDGKPVTLSGSPQEIEGKLYLPYELLTLCNGVLTRWEPKKSTLYVDTRFLRRPDLVSEVK